MDPIELAELIYKQATEKKYTYKINIYNETNEDLYEIFNNYDMFDKDVLTVLASSDQLFSCYAKNAKSVDTFDMEYTTLYYYYLRKWFVLYKDLICIPHEMFIKSEPKLYSFISSIVTKSENEKNAKAFWMKYLELHNHTLGTSLFIINNYKYEKLFASNTDSLKLKLQKDPTFYNLNISRDIDIDTQYDIIILSNILEYYNSRVRLPKIRDNIEKLLNDDGIAICSTIIENNRFNASSHQKEIDIMTSNKLELLNEINYYDDKYKTNSKIAYTYKKSR